MQETRETSLYCAAFRLLSCLSACRVKLNSPGRLNETRSGYLAERSSTECKEILRKELGHLVATQGLWPQLAQRPCFCWQARFGNFAGRVRFCRSWFAGLFLFSGPTAFFLLAGLTALWHDSLQLLCRSTQGKLRCANPRHPPGYAKPRA